MSATDTQIRNTDAMLKIVWRNWAVAYGAIILPILIAAFAPKIWVPFVCLAESYLLISLMRSDLDSVVSRCSLVIFLASRVLLLTSAIMFVVVILCTDWLVPTVIHLDLYNSEIPFITCLVEFPAAVVMCSCTLYLGYGKRHCRECQRRNGYYAGDSIVATLYYRESKYQVAVLLILSLMLGAVEYWYYFARYINSDLNAPDRFFFNYMPVAMYVLSLVFMAGRYASMRRLLLALEESRPGAVNSTVVRYLIFNNDDLLLHQGTEGLWDTPAEAVIARAASIGDPQASLLLTELTGIANFRLRYCFTNDGFAIGSNVIHYAAFIDGSPDEAPHGGDCWFNTYMLDNALATNSLAPLLANELYRIHTMTMAWKTYSREGHRLYPIKHYRPTFRFRDLHGWAVDYDDPTWFDIAHNNEDRPFFRSRQLWSRLTGIFKRKRMAQ